MTAALTLFDAPSVGRVRRRDPATSLAAARSVNPGVPALILDVLAASRVPLTSDQIASELPLVRQDTLRSALARLHHSGRVRSAGEGESNARRPMQKWELAR